MYICTNTYFQVPILQYYEVLGHTLSWLASTNTNNNNSNTSTSASAATKHTQLAGDSSTSHGGESHDRPQPLFVPWQQLSRHDYDNNNMYVDQQQLLQKRCVQLLPLMPEVLAQVCVFGSHSLQLAYLEFLHWALSQLQGARQVIIHVVTSECEIIINFVMYI